MCLLVEQCDFVRQTEIEELVHRVEDMSAPVAKGSHTEVVPRAPFTLMVFAGIVVPLGSAEPSIPIHTCGQRLSLGQVLDIRVEAMPTAAVVHVCRDGSDVLDDASLLPCLELEVVALGVSLVANLCGQLGMAACHLHQQLSLEEGARHGLLQIDVLAVGERHHGDGEVDMVGHGGYDSLEVICAFLEELAEVAIALDVGVLCEYLLALFAIEVHIAEGCDFDHARAQEVVEVLFATVADANEGNFHLVAFGVGRLAGGHEMGSSGGDTWHATEGDACNTCTHCL